MFEWNLKVKVVQIQIWYITLVIIRTIVFDNVSNFIVFIGYL